jgi:hypothetical protein
MKKEILAIGCAASACFSVLHPVWKKAERKETQKLSWINPP